MCPAADCGAHPAPGWSEGGAGWAQQQPAFEFLAVEPHAPWDALPHALCGDGALFEPDADLFAPAWGAGVDWDGGCRASSAGGCLPMCL